MKRALWITLAATLGFTLILVLAPGPREEVEPLQTNSPPKSERGSNLGGGLNASIASEGVYTSISALTEVEGTKLRYTAVFLATDRSRPGQADEHLFEGVTLGFAAPPKTLLAAERLFELPIAPKASLPSRLSAAIGGPLSGIFAGTAKARATRDLQSIAGLDLERSVRIVLAPESQALETQRPTELETEAATVKLEEGRLSRIEGVLPVRLQSEFGRLTAEGFDFDPRTQAGALRGLVEGRLNPSALGEILLPGSDPGLPMELWVEDGVSAFSEVPGEAASDRSTLIFNGAFRVSREMTSVTGRDLHMEVQRDTGALIAMRTAYPLTIAGEQHELEVQGLLWRARVGEVPSVLESTRAPAKIRWPLRAKNADGTRLSEVLNLRAEGGFVWHHFGETAASVQSILASGGVHLFGEGLDGKAKTLEVRLTKSLRASGAERFAPDLVVFRGEAWMTIAEGGASGEEIRLERLQGGQAKSALEVLEITGRARFGLSSLFIPAKSATQSFAEALGEKAWTEIRANQSIRSERTLSARSVLRIDANNNVRIERRPAIDAEPLAVVAADSLSLVAQSDEDERVTEVQALSQYQLLRVLLKGRVQGTTQAGFSFSSERLSLDWRGQTLELGGAEEARLKLEPGGRSAAAVSIVFDLKLKSLKLSQDVELRTDLPTLSFGPAFGDRTDEAGTGAERPTTVRADEALVWLESGQTTLAVRELVANSKERLLIDQPGHFEARLNSVRWRRDDNELELRGAPVELLRQGNSPQKDRFIAQSVEAKAGRIWIQGPMEASFHTERGQLALDVKGFGTRASAGELSPVRASALRGALLTERRALFEGDVSFAIDKNEKDESSFRGEQLLLSTEASANSGPRRLERAILTGKTEFRTAQLSGSGEVLQLAADRKRLTLKTPGGRARLKDKRGSEQVRLRFEIDYADNDNPRVIASDVPER